MHFDVSPLTRYQHSIKRKYNLFLSLRSFPLRYTKSTIHRCIAHRFCFFIIVVVVVVAVNYKE